MPRSTRRVAVLVPIEEATTTRIRGHRTGQLVAIESEGPLVDYAGNPHGPLRARTTIGAAGAPGFDVGADLLLVFEEERSDRPIVVGVLVVPQRNAEAEALRVNALVDGERVVLEGRAEIVLRCGQASITLRQNGRVVIQGTYVETRSRGVNRIKGGSVQIN